MHDFSHVFHQGSKELQAAVARRGLSDQVQDRSNWLSIALRVDILDKTAKLMEEQSESLALEAAREGGKPLQDSRVEVARAIDGVRNCIECLRSNSGREIPMSQNTASAH